jgi:serine protease
MSSRSFSSIELRKNFVASLLVIAASWALFAVPGCKDDDSPPQTIEGAISGHVIVPPNHVLETEPNDNPDTAQSITQASRVSGEAASDDPGFGLPGREVEAQDFYRVTTTAPVRVMLIVGANELFTYDPDSDPPIEVINDLDLAVLDGEGNLIDFSEGLSETETVDVSETGELTIAVRATAGSSPYVLGVTPLELASDAGAAPALAVPSPAPDFVPGEVLMKRAPAAATSVKSRNALAASNGARFRKSLPPDVDVLQLNETTTSTKLNPGARLAKIDPSAIDTHLLKAATLEVVKRLQADPAVAWAQPNYIRRALLTPDDELYERQWHYENINLPQAWETTTGSSDVIVAVIDTGILSEHPDIPTERLVPGYDFVSDAFRGQDGDGIDPDPEDEGDDPRNRSSSFHGTHVAGTIGARTDNGDGVAGVNWDVRIMPIRVLGVLGGTASEVSQGIRFAAGLTNESDTVPDEPARVINMSLGGAGTSPIEQAAVTDARNAGTIIIAAAGNDSSSDEYSPAGLDGVISVSASTVVGTKASYSNYGDKVDVAAPGGEFWDSDGDDQLDAVLSTLGNDDGDFIYKYYQGTSMASPHMAGVVALMLAVNPELDPDDIDMLLAGTHPDTSRRITIDLGRPGRDDFFGHGLIDAAAAVIAASEVGDGGDVSPTGPILSVYPSSLDFREFQSALPLAVTNSGTGTLNVTSVTTDSEWLAATPTSGEAPLAIEVTVDRSGLADGSYMGTVQIETDATEGSASADVSVAMTIGAVATGDAGPTIVRVLSADGSRVVAEVTTDAAQDYAYTTPAVEPGTYIVVAGTDRDGDSNICDIEDACGLFQEPVTVADSGEGVTDVSFLLTFGVGQRPPPVDNELPE